MSCNCIERFDYFREIGITYKVTFWFEYLLAAAFQDLTRLVQVNLSCSRRPENVIAQSAMQILI